MIEINHSMYAVSDQFHEESNKIHYELFWHDLGIITVSFELTLGDWYNI